LAANLIETQHYRMPHCFRQWLKTAAS